MDNSIYVTLSRQMVLFRDMEVTANNIANVNTVGYNAEKLSFKQHLVDAEIDGRLGRDIAFARDPSSYRDTSGGPMRVTGNTLDLAISGPGYFQIESPLGVRYSKAGNFQVDAEGTLVTPDGYPVLSGDGGTIVFPDNATDIQINDQGLITVAGDEVGQVGVVEFENQQALKRTGNNFFTTDQDPLPAETARVLQGVLEGSNVQSVKELVRVVELQRGVGATAKFIETMYDLERRTADTYTKQIQA
jgi:flagellar basal-body rod protein FlgF